MGLLMIQVALLAHFYIQKWDCGAAHHMKKGFLTSISFYEKDFPTKT